MVLRIAQDEFIVPQRIFFSHSSVVIEKMGDAMRNFHVIPPLAVG
jgi:hypothetical protein